MSDEAKIMIIGVYLWGALYVAGVFVASIAWHDEAATIAILTSAGLAYICQVMNALAQLQADQRLATLGTGFMLASAISAAGAGALLLARI